jgi:hypothetical protein
MGQLPTGEKLGKRKKGRNGGQDTQNRCCGGTYGCLRVLPQITEGRERCCKRPSFYIFGVVKDRKSASKVLQKTVNCYA